MESYNDINKFIDDIKKVKEHRNHKVKNSLGVYSAYKFYRKNKPKEHKYILTESQYFKIIRETNKILAEQISKGNDVTFPKRMGKLEIRKYAAIKTIKDGAIKTNLPIDWNNTIKLWYEDPESFAKKTLIRLDSSEIFKIYYNKGTATYKNKCFYKFNVNRALKLKLKQNIKEGIIDAFDLNT